MEKKINRNRSDFTNNNDDNMTYLIAHYRRVCRVHKGGKALRSSVLTIAGNEKGSVGYGLGKATENSEAVKKANKKAKKNLLSVDLFKGRTFFYDVQAKYGSAIVYLRKAKSGTGIVAGGVARYILEAAGVKDAVCKTYGRNPINIAKAMFAALQKLKTLNFIAKARGVGTDRLFYNSGRIANEN